MEERRPHYKQGSLSLTSTVAMGIGVMIGAGIFAITGQVAELAGGLFPIAFIAAALISLLSAYSYIKVSNKHPSAGGIGMVLTRAYGKGTITGAASLLMVFSMMINESLVARTFGTYFLQLFSIGPSDTMVPVLALLLIAFAFIVNVASNKVIGTISNISAVLKVGGLLVFAAIALAASGISFETKILPPSGDPGPWGLVGGIALAILAYKGFTTITNSGEEVSDPERNIGRAILISLAICLVVYLFVCIAVSSNLSLPELIAAKDYALAEAARPAIGGYGTQFTVVIALIATVSCILASVFAVSRLLAMLTEMKLIPHSHLGLPGDMQKHTLVYTVVTAGVLAVLFDLSRIASIGAIFYLTMDATVHWGVFRHLHAEVGANRLVVLSALSLDLIALGAFLVVKGLQDPFIVVSSMVAILVIVLFERFYTGRGRPASETKEEG